VAPDSEISMCRVIIYLFVMNLFKDAVINSDNMESNGRIFNYLLIGRDAERNGRGVTWKCCPGICSEGLKKSRYPGRYLKPEPTEHDAQMLNTRARYCL
jgi:hypothetical protein